MNLTEKEISNFNKARTEDDFYKQYSKVKEARNNILNGQAFKKLNELKEYSL